MKMTKHERLIYERETEDGGSLEEILYDRYESLTEKFSTSSDKFEDLKTDDMLMNHVLTCFELLLLRRLINEYENK